MNPRTLSILRILLLIKGIFNHGLIKFMLQTVLMQLNEGRTASSIKLLTAMASTRQIDC